MSVTTITPTMDAAITQLFDTITSYECCTQADIATAGGFAYVAEVSQALAWVRDPDIAAAYGWTVPHVRRGRPREDQDYRYLVVGLSGQILADEDIKLVGQGALSTVSHIYTETRNEANALRLSAPLINDRKYKKWAKNTATILDGISVQAELEVARLEKLLVTMGP